MIEIPAMAVDRASSLYGKVVIVTDASRGPDARSRRI